MEMTQSIHPEDDYLTPDDTSSSIRKFGGSNQSNTDTNSTATEIYKRHCTCSHVQKQFVSGVIITIAMGVAWLGFTHFGKNTYTDTFSAPLVVVYFYTSWMIVFYPVYITIAYIVARGSVELKQLFRESIMIYKEEEFKPIRFSVRTLIFCFVWTVGNYSYIRALRLLGAMDVIALYATNQSFVYMLSWIVLFEKFIAIRILAMIFSITGIVLFAYADGFGNPNMWGVVLAVTSASAAAVYKMLIKKFIGEASFGKISLFLSLIGFGNLLCLWPFILLFYLTKTETVDWSILPWTPLCASAVLATVHQFLSNYSGVITFSIFLEMGLLIGIPLCAVADLVWRNAQFPGMRVSAAVLIEIGLLLIILPEGWHTYVMRLCRCLKQEPNPVTSAASSDMPRPSRFEWRNTTY